MVSGRLSVCPSVVCDISLLSEGISTKLATNIHHVTGKCWKGFNLRGQRSRSYVCMYKCVNAVMSGGIHYDGVASRLIYFC